jgi:hypothetical protein
MEGVRPVGEGLFESPVDSEPLQRRVSRWGGSAEARMSGVEMSGADAAALVQRIMHGDYASDDEVDGWLVTLDRSLGCPSGYVSDLIFCPSERARSADEVVDEARRYRPIAL